MYRDLGGVLGLMLMRFEYCYQLLLLSISISPQSSTPIARAVYHGLCADYGACPIFLIFFTSPSSGSHSFMTSFRSVAHC